MKKLLLISACFIVLLSQSKCTARSSTLFKDPICEPPCWQSIVPGVTTKEQALSIVENLPAVEPDSLWTNGNENVYSSRIQFSFSTGEYVFIYLISDKVAKIDFESNYAHQFDEPLGVTFGECTEYFGEPEYIVHMYVAGAGPLMGDSFHPIILAVNPEKGISFGYDAYYIPKRQRSAIRPEIELHLVSFFDPNAFEQLAKAMMFFAKWPSGYWHPWKGYVDLETNYPIPPYR